MNLAGVSKVDLDSSSPDSRVRGGCTMGTEPTEIHSSTNPTTATALTLCHGMARHRYWANLAPAFATI